MSLKLCGPKPVVLPSAEGGEHMKKQTVSFHLDEETVLLLKAIALIRRKTLSGLLRDIVFNALKEMEDDTVRAVVNALRNR